MKTLDDCNKTQNVSKRKKMYILDKKLIVVFRTK